jgi:hypothetical protein
MHAKIMKFVELSLFLYRLLGKFRIWGLLKVKEELKKELLFLQFFLHSSIIHRIFAHIISPIHLQYISNTSPIHLQL